MSKSGLRFVLITTFYPPYHFGGDANYVRQLAHILARRGHQVDIIHDIDAFRLLNKGTEPEPVQEPMGINVYGMQSPLGGLSCLATQQFGYPVVHGSKIKKILSAGNYDIIHFHNISLVGGPGILAYGDAIKLYTAHEHWLVCPTHVLWRHNREVCTGRECVRCSLHYHRPLQLWRNTGLLEQKSRHIDAFCSPSQFSAEKHQEFNFHRKLSVLPSFLPDTNADSKIAADNAAGIAPVPYFLFVGRLEKIKGIQDVIPLFDHDASADLYIAGSGDYEGELRKLANDSPHVRFLGQCSAEQLRLLYARAIAVIMPSICYEVFPLVALEAFREGTPIVARNLGPYPEIVEQSKGGLLFETRDELKHALAILSTDPELRQKLGNAGLNAFTKYWSEQAAMAEYFKLIERIARSRGDTRVLETLNRQTGKGDML